MQKLTKSQVIALFLSTASAATLTPATLLNGPSSADRVPADQTLTTAMSATECTGNASCTEDNESCGYFQMAEGDSSNICVADAYCKAIGKLNGVAFSLSCWATPAEGVTATQPADVNVADYLAQIKDLITKPTVAPTWDAAQNLFVSPKFNFQDGWWIEGDDGKFTETDKAADGRCAIDAQCGADECCGMWPDQNNKRCFAKSLDGKAQSAGPITFTPSCVAQEVDVEPENAVDDIAKGALAEAAEALGSFYDNQEADAKKAAGYDEMSAEDKKAWDEKKAAADKERQAFWDELKTEVGFADFDDAKKAIFEEDLLEWGKENYEKCKSDPKSIECREGKELKKKIETARAGKGDGETNYYAMTSEERKNFNKNYADQAKKNMSALAAAFLKANPVAAGENGAACGAEGMCPEGQCCGYSVPKPEDGTIVFDTASDAADAAGDLLGGLASLGGEEAASAVSGLTSGLSALGGLADMASSVVGRVPVEGELSNVCVKSASINEGTKTSWTNELNQGYDHTCLAKNLAATATAAIAVAYSLM